eukprot:TRINITY_DN10880_c0_g1_i1.p1 TRINITY_DN10880_c0_g1~~TRINITY_DN10880_c0_g1_i1.p1  ORF type:complete len:259 (-),score=40.55 TRINITY_DN10880_c0_g1_i1:59-835(-)
MATMSSPCDPLFYLHHANVDRILSIWQDCHNYDKEDVLKLSTNAFVATRTNYDEAYLTMPYVYNNKTHPRFSAELTAADVYLIQTTLLPYSYTVDDPLVKLIDKVSPNTCKWDWFSSKSNGVIKKVSPVPKLSGGSTWIDSSSSDTGPVSNVLVPDTNRQPGVQANTNVPPATPFAGGSKSTPTTTPKKTNTNANYRTDVFTYQSNSSSSSCYTIIYPIIAIIVLSYKPPSSYTSDTSFYQILPNKSSSTPPPLHFPQ